MPIAMPRQAKAYADRALDCEQAVEAAFLAEVQNAGTAFIDLDHVLSGIAEEATRAGWSEQEITDAVIQLARRHSLQSGLTATRMESWG